MTHRRPAAGGQARCLRAAKMALHTSG